MPELQNMAVAQGPRMFFNSGIDSKDEMEEVKKYYFESNSNAEFEFEPFFS